MLLLIDNNDSFTYNLVDMLHRLDIMPFTVVNISALHLDDVAHYSHILISPGPDVPEAYPQLFSLLSRFAESKSIFGVCLGHQVICRFFGARLYNLAQVKHGQDAQINIVSESSLFQNMPSSLQVALYHSWAVDLAECTALAPLAYDESQTLMAVMHKQLPIFGVQFHPESFVTQFGEQILYNWLSS